MTQSIYVPSANLVTPSISTTVTKTSETLDPQNLAENERISPEVEDNSTALMADLNGDGGP